VAATVRSGEPATDPALIGEIGQDPMAALIRPGPLSLAAVAELVRGRLGDNAEDAFCAACHRATGGNPLLVRQLLSALESDGVEATAANADVVRNIGPRAVGRSVLLRLARLPGDAVSVARAVAVLGDHAELPAIARLAGLSEESVAEATGALARAEILRHEPPIGFAHPLIQDAIYRELPPGERELQHSRAARVLAELGGIPEQVAAHVLQVPRRADPWAVDVLIQAGRSAGARGSAESAVTYLRRALEEPPSAERRPDLLLELGLAELSQSADAAIDHLTAAYHELPDAPRRAVAAEAAGRIMLLSKPPEQALALLDEAYAALGGATDPELVDVRTGVHAIALLARHFGGGDLDALEAFKDYRDPPAEMGPGTRKMVAMAAYDWSRTDGTAAECTALAYRALDESLLADDVVAVGSLFVLLIGDHPDAVRVFDEWYANAHRNASLLSAASVLMWRGELISRHGDVAAAEADITLGFDQLDAWGHDPAQQWTAGFLSRARVEVGDIDGAEEALARAGRLQPAGDGPLHWMYGRVVTDLAAGRPEDALGTITAVEAKRDRFENPAYMPWRSLKAIALDRLDRTDEAIPHAEEGLRRARHWGAPSTVGQALRMLGTIERAAGIPRLEEAVAVLEHAPARLELAKALLALGGALRRDRRPSDAREPLRRALEIADVCGAVPTADEARTELYATGARPRTEALSGAAALTASERRVVDLAIDGQTNRDIAQTLFVTPKTVEVHLSNAYRKLGIRSRRELADALQPTG
jgi:DNA-binding CsgD family transcriptional regulator